jgi:hypothetical protein
MLRSLQRVRFPLVLRSSLLRPMSTTVSSDNAPARPGAVSNGTDDPVLFKHAQRLIAGRALAQDVWSIFNPANLPTDTINLGQGVRVVGEAMPVLTSLKVS